MPIVDFTDEELRNLHIFLGRTQITGQEVPAFIPIVAKINTAADGTQPKQQEVVKVDADA